VDTFTGLALGYSTTPMAGMGPRPAWAPSALSDLHSAGAVMWVGGDGIMFALMMVVFLAWSREGQISVSGHGWLESARRASFAGLTGSGQERSTAGAAAGEPRPAGATIDDDEHLAAYNAYLARINAAEPPGHGRNTG